MVFRRFATLLILAALPTTGIADPKPRGAQNATPQKVSQAYVGKTDIWAENCNGGIYFAPNLQLRAWCKDNSESLGVGRWTVDTEGTLCQSITWFWRDGGNKGSTKAEPVCISHVMDKRGRVWRSWRGDPEWWPVTGDSGMVRGYKFQNEVRSTKSRLGL